MCDPRRGGENYRKFEARVSLAKGVPPHRHRREALVEQSAGSRVYSREILSIMFAARRSSLTHATTGTIVRPLALPRRQGCLQCGGIANCRWPERNHRPG